MTQSSHTPGPWTLIEEGDRCEELKVIGPEQKGSFYPKTIANAGIVYGAEDVANFALIAAAPKLLAALQRAEKALDSVFDGWVDGVIGEALFDVRIAIAEATGEERIEA